MVLGTDFLYSWSLMWDSEELQTIASQTLWYLYNRALSKPVFVLRFGFSPGQTSHPLTQSCSDSFKKQPKGSRTWLGCLVGNSTTSWHPSLCWGAGGAEPARHSSQGSSVPLAGTHSRDNSRAMPDPGAREITAKSPWPKCIRLWGSLILPFHVPALSNSRGAPCHCGLLFSLAPISGTLRGCAGFRQGLCPAPAKIRYMLRLWRGEVPGAEPVNSRTCSIPGWLGSTGHRGMERRALMEEHVLVSRCSWSALSVLPLSPPESLCGEWWILLAPAAALSVLFWGSADWRSFLTQAHSVSMAMDLLGYEPSGFISLSLQQGQYFRSSGWC